MLCVLILKWLITKCCLCLSKVVRALFLINDAREVKGECKTELVRALLSRSLHSQFIFLNALQSVQKIFQTTKYFSHFFNPKAKIFWLSISYAKKRNFFASKITDFAQISTTSSPMLTSTPHAARRNFSVLHTRSILSLEYYILLYIL